jgi:hypothetical protein
MVLKSYLWINLNQTGFTDCLVLLFQHRPRGTSMTGFESFYKFIRPYVTGCPEPIIDNAIRDAARDFCKQSLCVRGDIPPIDIVQDTAFYDLSPSALAGYLTAWQNAGGSLTENIYGSLGDSQIVVPLNVKFNDAPINPISMDQMNQYYPAWESSVSGTPRFYLFQQPERIRLWQTPNAELTGGLKIHAAFQPSMASDTFDDFLFNQWGKQISDGALAEILKVPNKPWTSVDGSAHYSNVFQAHCHNARISSDRGFIKQSRHVKMVPFV